MTRGADVSHYQSDSLVRQLASSLAFVVVKASEGLTSDDPGGQAAHDRQVGLVRGKAVVGHYHFAKVCAAWKAEADNFLARANVQPGDIVALDMEAMDGGWGGRVAYARQWLAYVAAKTGSTPWLYVNGSWLAGLRGADAAGALDPYPVWIATGGKPEGQPGVSGWAVHQWSTGGGYDHNFVNPNLTLDDLTGASVALTADDAALVARYVWTGGPGAGQPAYYKSFLTSVSQAVAAAVADAVQAAPAGAAVDPHAIAAEVVTALAARLAS